MIVSEVEIAAGTDASGIMVLDDGIEPGTPLDRVVPLGSDVIEFEITPNRPDCLSVYGIARELHAATGASLADPPWTEDPGAGEGNAGGVTITVEAPDLCPRFTARVFEGVRIGPSPPWLRARLIAAGMRPISNVVDITNYVMHVTGQPLHAFDLDRVAGERLVVRRARDGERVETLDGIERIADAETVLICDADGPTSIAGIMGGARSEVGPRTTRVLLEAATWVGPNIHRSALRLGLRSEASGRFEKGLPPEATLEAQALATGLMVEMAGARALAGTIDIAEPLPVAPLIRLRPQRVRDLLGTDISLERCVEILELLGFGVERAFEELDVQVPHWRRNDVTREVDLIEEVARIDGVDRLPSTLPARRGAIGRLTHEQRARRRAEDALAACGLHEVVGWSFTDPGLLDRLRLPADDPLRRVVTLENPLSENQSVMRPTLVGSLLDVARHNAAHGVADIAIFESGRVYRAGEGELADEHHALGGLLSGAASPRDWRSGEPPAADFFAAKAVLGALLDALHVRWSVEAHARPFLHPGRGARVLGDGQQIGFVGELHPAVAGDWDLERTAVFAVDLDRVATMAPEQIAYQDIASFPPVREDIAVIVDDAVPAARLLEVVRAAAGETLARAEVFDVYRGGQVGDGRVSLALHLEFRAPDRTLTDAEVAEQRAAVAAAVREQLGGDLRA
jgi:phenylalanyl-tRNA synthetase beta chain